MFRNIIIAGFMFGAAYASTVEIGTMTQGQNSPFDC